MSFSRETPSPHRRHHRSVDRGVAVVAGVVAALAALVLAAAGIAAALVAGAGSPAERPAEAAPASPAARPAPAPVSRTAPPAPATSPSSAGTVTLAAVGDMLFGRSTADVIARKGGAAPLANVAPLLASADVTVGNLEGAISTAGVEAEWKDVRLRGDPRAVEGLQLAGFDAVGLANNHALDFGWPAARDTIARLQAARVGVSGAGANAAEAWKPVVVDRRGTGIAILSFTRVLPEGFGATGTHPGVASAYEEAQVIRAIRDAKKRYGHVVAQFHWGVEYADRPKSYQVDLAHHAIDAGADVVLGHHPHVIEGLEVYKGKLIAYSLGDFVFEHYSTKTGEAFILNAEIGPRGVANVEAVPVYLDEQGVPSVVQGKVARRILDRLRDLSAERGVELAIDGDRGRVILRGPRP